MAMNAANHIDDAELLQQLRDGNQAAFDTVFRLFHPALCFFAKRLAFDLPKGQAEEIVQDTFVKLWERRANFVDLTAVKAFLYITTRNACLNELDKEKVRNKKEERYLRTMPELEDAVVEEIIYAEVLREVAHAIETLPEQCQRIVKMAYEEGLTAKEIAASLNITVSTVNNQKSRGIALLRKRLSDTGFAFLLFFL